MNIKKTISFQARAIFVGFCTLLLGACATDLSVGLAPEVTQTSLETLPPPRGEISYAIGPQEKLEIEVVGAETLSGTYLTDIDGRLAFPLLGILEIGGQTPSEASLIIAKGLRGRYLLDPQVRVIPEDIPIPSISVGGQVKSPGAYSAVGKQTLLRVVNQAGGLEQFARLDDVLVLRSVDNQNYIGVYNISAIQRGNYPDPQLYPNDIVIVGDSPQRRRIDGILRALPQLFNTAIILLTRL
jgi:polysaccharide export outer membrane protein